MQALWSRAGQAHRCGCRRASDAVVSTLGRRVTTATRPRKVTIADVFTACYSSMFATAALVDAVVKEDRRQELDRLLEETRRELAQLQLQNLEATQSTTENISLGQMHHLWESIKDMYTNRPYMKEIYRPATIRIDEFLNRVQTEQYQCPDKATMDAYRRTDYENLEQTIMHEETDDSIVHRRPMNPKQLHNAGRTVNHLIQQLLKRAAAHDKSNLPSPSFDEAVKFADQIPSYKFLVESDLEMMKKNRATLNLGLRKVVGSSLNLKEKVGRVCYNLLVSAYPADMHTYNTLIVAFDRHGYKYLAESVVNSFYYYRRLSPTPSTFVAILNHYKDSGNYGRFLRSLACITGLDDKTGAKVRRRLAEGFDSSRSRRDRIQTWTQTGDYFWQHAPLNKPVVEAVIHGLLRVNLIDQAAMFFVSCMKNEVVLGTQIIKQLFDECIAALDWRSAVRLIQGFAHCSFTWPSMLLGRDRDTAYLIGRLRVLLDLAGLQNSTGEVSTSVLDNLSIPNFGFRKFLSDLATADSTSQLEIQDSTTGLVSSPGRRLLQIEALWKEQDFIAKTIRSIESKLLYPDLPQNFRESMASHIGKTAANNVVGLNREIMEVLARLPRSDRVEKGLAECKIFEDASVAFYENSASVPRSKNSVSGALSDNSIFEKLMQSRRTTTGEQTDAELAVSLRDDEPQMPLTGTTANKRTNTAGRKPLRARSMRRTTLSATDERVGYSERPSFG
ncbi:hypothetical protein FPSE_04975 [Fusarium pseudograminearum CS3096]|uniref:Pentatricopeptide repeat domain-containing protein n=1 Tax=Fusarium pseudograminearum (strain CS3096) TaxID=1028729 RepID=K3UR40_FUSPC|nr:hypothetical protein FPSE_04975 [Fusarium pseudograminearum CS3096]EKJ74801.1 hypothetical protein FPSE_04975 [Fusarium pseudograminearum CS3096]KAF0640420.1 hypothetical protein FPSE5266_04975 [Fusarium pseudograminearum]